MASEMKRLAFIALGTKPPTVKATPKTNMPHAMGEWEAPRKGAVANGPKPKHHKERYKRMYKHDHVDSSTCGSRHEAAPDQRQEGIAVSDISSHSERIVVNDSNKRRTRWIP
jgi:hypothetical protein